MPKIPWKSGRRSAGDSGRITLPLKEKRRPSGRLSQKPTSLRNDLANFVPAALREPEVPIRPCGN
jgi:hypothetical protein